MINNTAQKLKDLEVAAINLLPTALQDLIDVDIDEVGGDIFEEYTESPLMNCNVEFSDKFYEISLSQILELSRSGNILVKASSGGLDLCDEDCDDYAESSVTLEFTLKS